MSLFDLNYSCDIMICTKGVTSMFEEILTGKENKVKEKINGFEMFSDELKENKYYLYPYEYERLNKPMTNFETEQVDKMRAKINEFDKAILDKYKMNDYDMYKLRYKKDLGYYRIDGTNENQHASYDRIEYFGDDFVDAFKLILNMHIRHNIYLNAYKYKDTAKTKYYNLYTKYFTKKDILRDEEGSKVFGFAPGYAKYYTITEMEKIYKEYYGDNMPDQVKEYLEKCMNFYLMRPIDHEWKYEDKKGLVLKKQN